MLMTMILCSQKSFRVVNKQADKQANLLVLKIKYISYKHMHIIKIENLLIIMRPGVKKGYISI